jgi:hypothetical protein
MLILMKKAKRRKLNGSGRSFLQDNLQMELLHTQKHGIPTKEFLFYKVKARKMEKYELMD